MPRQANAEGPKTLPGTAATHRRRRGQPNCRGAAGEELHEQVILTSSQKSRTRSVTRPTERYRTAPQKLEAEATAGRETFVTPPGRQV